MQRHLTLYVNCILFVIITRLMFRESSFVLVILLFFPIFTS